MKAFKFLSTALVLAAATTVTAGSMYITVRAAAQQQDSVVSDVPAPVQDATPADSVVDATQAVPSVNDPLSPDKLPSDRSSTIVLDAEGGFTGRLTSLAAADGAHNAATEYTVKVLQRGGVIGSSKTDSDGRFALTGLEPGVSGILAFSETGLMLFGARLVASDDATAIAAIGGNDIELDLDSAVVTAKDVPLARQMIMSALSSGDQRFSGDVSADDEKFQFGTGEPSSSLLGHSVHLLSDGTLEGVVTVLDPRTGKNREVLDMTVHFLRDGQLIASAEAENDGSFVVAGLNPGIHSVVGTGQDGVFAIGVEILGSAYEPAANGQAKDGEFIPASLVQSSGLSITVVGPGIVNKSNFQSLTDGTSQPGPGAPPVASTPSGPMGSGGGGSGAGGGGAAGGGGGGLAGLLVGAAAGVGGYLAGQNNSDPPASP